MSNIQQLFHDFVNSGGDPKVTSFKRHLDKLINVEIKPLCGRSGKSADGTNWRDELKARFSGKGAKWVLVSLGEISPTITQLEANGVDCDDFNCSRNARLELCDSPEGNDRACSDGVDNDADGYVDCEDYDCRYNFEVEVCELVEGSNETCSDGIDNNDNGFVDCDDFDCSRNPRVNVCD